MKLPNFQQACVSPEKLRDYLLSVTHPVGRSKAKMLHAAGFNETNIYLLRQGLMAIANSEDIIESVSTPYGVKYIIDGAINAPAGGVIRMRTVWIIETGSTVPRFVTAYPV